MLSEVDLALTGQDCTFNVYFSDGGTIIRAGFSNSIDIIWYYSDVCKVYTMQLAERIQFKRSPALSALCHRAKNLYNLANFYVRQELFIVGDVLTYFDLCFMFRGKPAYLALPAQTAQQVLRQVAGDWHFFFAAYRAYHKDPGKFRGAPRPPRYKPRGGESLAVFTNQQCRVRDGWLHYPRKAGLPPVQTRVTRYQQVRVVPKGGYYVIEVVYNVVADDLGVDKRRALGVDLGVSNLVTAANNTGLPPFAIKGRKKRNSPYIALT